MSEHRLNPVLYLLCLSLAALGLPSGAAAQACLANGAAPGQGFAGVGASFTDGAWGPGANIGANTSGPLAVRAGVGHTLFDDSDIAATSVSGTAAAEVPAENVSICPAGSVAYQWLSNKGELEGLDVDADGVVLQGGMALGVDVQTEDGFRFIPQGTASVVHNRATISVGGVSDTESETYGAFSLGMMLGGNTVYGGPGVSFTTLDNSDPVFSASLGFVF